MRGTTGVDGPERRFLSMLPRERDVEDDDVDDEVEQVGEARASAWADVVEPATEAFDVYVCVCLCVCV